MAAVANADFWAWKAVRLSRILGGTLRRPRGVLFIGSAHVTGLEAAAGVAWTFWAWNVFKSSRTLEGTFSRP